MNQSNNKGTTLIEVLVVTVIAVILLGIAFLGYRGQGETLALRRNAYKSLADIEKTREMAMSAHPFSVGDAPEGGYGIYFNLNNRNQYIVFADIDANRQYDSPGELVETIPLEDNVELSAVFPNNPLYIVFLPPSPDVFINANDSPINEAEITIRLKNDHTQTATIKVSGRGAVWIE
jgi:prepilin-type N-terminal cleavage/methylation domain-containing protein